MSAPGRNRILIWMCALIAVNQLGFGSIVPVIALYARSFGVLQSAIGVAIGVYGLARFLIAVPAGQLADGLGRRNVLALGGSSPPPAISSAPSRRTSPPSWWGASSRGRARPSWSTRGRSSSPTSPLPPSAGA
jgi:MFS family permease